MATTKSTDQSAAVPATPAPEPAPADEAPEKPLDETEPGGKYMVNGVWVDAEGRPLEDKKD